MYLYVHNTAVAASCHTPSHTPSHTHTLKIYSLLINGWLVEPGCPVTTGSQQILQLQTPAVSHYFGFFPLHYFLGNSRVFNYYVCNKQHAINKSVNKKKKKKKQKLDMFLLNKSELKNIKTEPRRSSSSPVECLHLQPNFMVDSQSLLKLNFL